jgi:hypothetical protein
MNGKWSKEWATLIRHDIKNIDSGIRHNTPIKWATEIIKLNWNYVHDCWKQRNIIEHDAEGSPETRKKEKIVEHLLGISEKMNYKVYKKVDMTNEVLMQLPIENLIMIEINLKNDKNKSREDKKKNKMLRG